MTDNELICRGVDPDSYRDFKAFKETVLMQEATSYMYEVYYKPRIKSNGRVLDSLSELSDLITDYYRGDFALDSMIINIEETLVYDLYYEDITECENEFVEECLELIRTINDITANYRVKTAEDVL